MLSVLLQKKEGYRFYFVLSDGEGKYGGGLTDKGCITCDADCPQKELMLRTIVFKCINDRVDGVTAYDEWGIDLTRFGFTREGASFYADAQSIRLPHDCEDARE